MTPAEYDELKAYLIDLYRAAECDYELFTIEQIYTALEGVRTGKGVVKVAPHEAIHLYELAYPQGLTPAAS